jgi:glycosyltransferase involved in cell wall biosynthesis
MFRRLRIAVVIPAFDEVAAIRSVVDSVPTYVDDIVVVDDASTDGTGSVAASHPRATVIRHSANRGVGAAIVTGYRAALSLGVDVAVVMAGDGQMDPDDLVNLLEPIASGRADYVKGNRFLDPSVWRVMPPSRLAGNVALSLFTKITSGYWRLFDSQCGYTAATRTALLGIDLDEVFPRYGYPNDLLARLHAARMRVEDVRVKPVYGPRWSSGIRIPAVVPPIAGLLASSWFRRVRVESDQQSVVLRESR